jgi:hypothetical protein
MQRPHRIVAFTFVVATAASAADIPVAGSRVIVSRHGAREKLFFSSRDAAWMVPPPTGGNPGPLRIDVSSPLHPEPRTVHLPPVTGPVGWTASVDGHGAIRRYKFRNRYAPNGFSAVAAVTWVSHASFKLLVRSTVLDASGPQGGFRIRITDGENRYCARFDGSSVVADNTGFFSARDATSAGLADCSAASLGEPATSPCDLAPGSPSCGGNCASDETCTYNPSTGDCSCTGGTGLACGDSSPVCNGYCPVGTYCGGVTLMTAFGRSCECVPDGETACGDSEYPTCGGFCPDGSKVCRPLIESVSILPTAYGCTCYDPGACSEDIGNPDFGSCGPGADCPPGQVCAIVFGFFGCYAQCAPP